MEEHSQNPQLLFVQLKVVAIFAEKILKIMKFDDITGDGRLWAVRYDDENDNVLYKLFDMWSDVAWLRDFFKKNINDLSSFFKITDVNQAIYDTIEDNYDLQCLIMDISPDADLDKIFRPLDNNRTAEVLLGKEKARLKKQTKHPSWLRIYALKLSAGIYIVTGGAIKLTATMQEREHTLAELHKMEHVRQFLLNENIVDDAGFIDYLSET